MRRLRQRRGAGFGHIGQNAVDQQAQLFGRDVARRAHDHPVAGDDAVLRLDHVLAPQRRDRFDGPVQRAAIGMRAPDRLRQRLLGDGIGIGILGADDRLHLTFDAGHGVIVEARLGQRGGDQIGALVTVFAEETPRHGQRIVANIEADLGAKRLGRGGIGGGVHVARAFFQRVGHQADGAALAGRVKAGAAPEGEVQRGEGDGVILDQPGLDAAGRGDLLDLGREGREGHQTGGEEGAKAQKAHWAVSSVAVAEPGASAATGSGIGGADSPAISGAASAAPSGSSQPVTVAVLFRT